MERNNEILQLAEEIMIDITNDRIPLHNILLKASHGIKLEKFLERIKL